MGISTILLIGLSLSFDTFAVSVTTGIVATHIRFWQATKVAIIFAAFQGLMPLLGWLVGIQFVDYIKEYDHWIAFALLFIIGARMILVSLKPEEKRTGINPFKPIVLIGMALSTSIDALIVGITFAFIEVNIVSSVLIIGFVTYVAAMLGILFGKKAGQHFGKRIEIIGGLMLIAIGLKILLEHLHAGC